MVIVKESIIGKKFYMLTVLEQVEDITGTTTDPYHYKVKFYGAIPDIDINH